MNENPEGGQGREGGDTRRLLKVFGVAVTDFEQASDQLLARVDAAGTDASGELVQTVRELFELITETNARWFAITDRMFETQRKLLTDLTEALGE
ncbi:MAG: hypothetical protein V3U63_02915 [Gemmatimonadota bacterium]